jgi:hypothetical protein
MIIGLMRPVEARIERFSTARAVWLRPDSPSGGLVSLANFTLTFRAMTGYDGYSLFNRIRARA